AGHRRRRRRRGRRRADRHRLSARARGVSFQESYQQGVRRIASRSITGLARVGGKQSAFGAFLDSLVDRVGEGFMLTAVAYVFAREGNLLAVAVAAFAIAGSFLVPYARAKAEALGFR